ncbi:MAG: hypothetical protein JXA89_12160 [Anaerolineae bacterium]|nr:hypothetical protein [Anaerolineae bacterium]
MKELNINKKHLKYVGLLVALLLCVIVVDALAGKDARDAGKTAEDSVVNLFDIDLTQDVAGQLPPCTQTGREFWTLHLTTIRDAARAKGLTIQNANAVVDGKPEPYLGIGGEGQIVPVQITITTQDEQGRAETATSTVRVLMIKGENGQWLLDGLAIE